MISGLRELITIIELYYALTINPKYKKCSSAVTAVGHNYRESVTLIKDKNNIIIKYNDNNF